MLPLATGSTIRAVATVATAVTATIFGDEITTTDAFRKLYQGQLPSSVGTLYTVPASTSTLVKTIILANTTASLVTATLYVDGTADANSIGSLPIPANGEAIWAGDGWKILDANGAHLVASSSSVQNSRAVNTTAPLAGGGDLSADRTLSLNADGVDNTYLANMAQATFKMRAAGAGTGDPIDGTATQAKTALAIVSTDLSDFTEAAQDAAGALLADSPTLDVTYNDAGNAETARTLNPFVSRVTAASKTYAASDCGQWYERINGGSAMTDTLPTLAAADNGLIIGVHNKGTTVAETITFTGAGGEVIGDVATTYVLNFACRQTFIWTGTKWLFGAGNSNLTKSPTVAPAAGDFATFTDITGRQLSSQTLAATKTALGLTGTNSGDQTLGTLGAVPTSRLISTTAPITGGGDLSADRTLALTTSPVGQTPVGVTRNIATTAPITGGGALSADLTLALTTSPVGQTPVGVTRTITATAPITIDGGISGDLSANRTIAITAATASAAGSLSAADRITLNAINGGNSSLAVKRVFRPGDYMVGNTFDPTGSSDSTSSFTAMMTAVNALGDRSVIELPPGVFKVDPNVLCPTATAPITIVGAGRGVTVLIPNSGANHFMKLPSGADGIQISDFAIYNTSGTPFSANAGILTNNADSITIQRMLFVDLFIDVQVSGAPYTATTNGTTAISSVSPALVAGDVGKPVSGAGIVPGSTIATQAGASGTLSVAATSTGAQTIFIGNTIKCSIQGTLHSQSNGNASSVGVLVNNGLAGDTYVGPDVVMSNTGNTRRKASVELIESGHYEVLQCNLTGSQYGILIDPGAAQIVAFGFHTNVLCDSNSINGMRMDAVTATSTIKNIKSVNSWYSGTTVVNGSSAAAGVITTGNASGSLNGVTFSNDRFLNNRGNGFEHLKGTDFRFVDSDFKGNSSAGSGQSDGLFVGVNVSNWSINGGKFGGTDTVPTAGNQRYGISVGTGGDNIKIAPDDLSGNVFGPLTMGVTGANVFVNGCPGLPAPYARGAASASISTVITIANMLIPKGSTRAGTTFRVTAKGQHITTLGTDTFTVRCGTTNDAVGSAATNGVVVTAVGAGGAANDWVTVEFMVTVSASGAGGNINAQGAGIKNITPFSTSSVARASGAGFLAVDLTVDRYLTLAVAASAGATVVYTSTIEVVNY